jgi:hypothetical protein
LNRRGDVSGRMQDVDAAWVQNDETCPTCGKPMRMLTGTPTAPCENGELFLTEFPPAHCTNALCPIRQFP